MMAIRYEPNERTLATLYDRPSQGLRLSRKTLLAFGAVGLLYAGFGAMVLSYKITHKPAEIVDPPVITIDRWIPDEPQPLESLKVKQPPPIHKPTATTIPVNPIAIAPTPIATAPDGPIETLPTTTVVEPVPIAPARPRGPVMIKSPDWVSKPTAAQLGRVYPDRAAVEGISGAATLLCGVAANGGMVGCTVIDESPKGWRFGHAALASARYFKMSPRTVDGQVVEGAKVRIPMVFAMAD